MGYHFSKSKYCRFWQYPKMSWHSASSPKSRSARSDPNDPEPDTYAMVKVWEKLCAVAT